MKLYPISFLLRFNRELERLLIKEARRKQISQAEVLRRLISYL